MEYLHDYQREPVERFIERGNLLCALDTGGGKTVITIAAAEELLALGRVRRVMIVVPPSLKYQWAAQLAAFTDLPTTTKKLTVDGRRAEIRIADAPACVVIDGTPVQRAAQYRTALHRDCEYVILGYDQPVDDWRAVRKLAAGMVVVDEASCLRSAGSSRSKFYKDHLFTPYRLALTATPAENGRPEEIYSIMEWVDPDIFGRRPDLFDAAYVERDQWGAPTGWKNLDVLHQKLAPALFRLSQDDEALARYLPDVRKVTWTVPLDRDTWKVYEKIGTTLAAELENVKSSPFSVLNYYRGVEGPGKGGAAAGERIALEMLLSHPDLVRISGMKYRRTKGEQGSEYAASIMQDYDLSFLDYSPKLTKLHKELYGLRLNGDPKVMVFSRYPEMLKLISHDLPAESYVIYDGTMTPKQKAAATARFRTDEKCVYFLSSHAGARGNDMPMAQWLINYDLPWEHGTAHQINGRHVRASSEFEEVYVVNMVCKGTIEERKLDAIEQKGDVAGAMLDNRGARNGRIDNDIDSLRAFLVDSLGLTA